MIKSGRFIVSLDFELFWGVKDTKDPNIYGSNILGVRKVIPRLLDIFDKYGIHATFAIVGFLFFNGREQLKSGIPSNVPEYAKPKFSPYLGYMEKVGRTELEDPYHFAVSLIKEILSRPNHEIGSHTFSHYYCLEEGQDTADFKDDLIAFKNVALGFGVQARTLVFPRNQYRDEYLNICRQEGIVAYRGNENHWLYSSRNEENKNIIIKFLAILDSFVNITGYNCYTDSDCIKKHPYNIRSSRFLRPYLPSLRFLEPLKLHRIKSAMSYAAKKGLNYHLWWHPHNFGINQDKNFAALENILSHYQLLSERYNFKSMNIQEVVMQLDKH